MTSSRSPARVGLLVLGALLALAAGVFLIGDQNRLFASKNEYFLTATNVGGLNEGNPVRLNGVTVGLVEKIELPRAADEEELRVEISIEKRYANRIRQDSLARIRTLGLLGDKYIEVTSGSSGHEIIQPGGRIPTQPATNVDRLITSGEDVVDNLVAISHSFRNILARVDRGEGLVGELTTDDDKQLTTSLRNALDSIEELADALESGQGPLGRLIHDEAMGDRLAASIERFAAVLDKVESGPGLLPAMLDDEALKEETQATLVDLREAAASARAFSEKLEEGDGLASRLITDEELSRRVTEELESLLRNLNQASEKLNRGDGTAAQLLNDPEIYQAVQDIIVGVNESKLLRWLIRNRQKKGIEVRYEDALEEGATPASTPEPSATPPP